MQLCTEDQAYIPFEFEVYPHEGSQGGCCTSRTMCARLMFSTSSGSSVPSRLSSCSTTAAWRTQATSNLGSSSRLSADADCCTPSTVSKKPAKNSL